MRPEKVLTPVALQHEDVAELGPFSNRRNCTIGKTIPIARS